MVLPPPNMEWQRESLCLDHKYAGLFDDPDTRNPGREERRRLEKAMSVCADCPVRAECLAFGIESHGTGVHGGILLRGGKPVSLIELFARGRRVDRQAHPGAA